MLAEGRREYEIALALGVPPMLLGIPGDNTYSNLTEAQRTFWRATVLPLVERIASALSLWLSPAYGSVAAFGLTPRALPLRLVPDLDGLPALAPEREALWASLERTSFLTTDEKRALAGFSPLPAGPGSVGPARNSQQWHPAADASTQARIHSMQPASGARLVALETKSIADDGTFEGYASLFDTEDLGRDVILPGAFGETLRRRGPHGIRLLFQHDPAAPIGVWESLVEDRRGLRARGRLATGAARAREVLALLRAGAIDGLSIGFRPLEADRDRRGGIRRIRKVDLWEISIVTFPMLPGARISRVPPPCVQPPAMPPPLAARSLATGITDAASRMQGRLAGRRHGTPLARAADLAGERALLGLMRLGLLQHKSRADQHASDPAPRTEARGPARATMAPA